MRWISSTLVRFSIVAWGFGNAGVPLLAAEPWHLNGWPYRAVVQIDKPSNSPEVDCAAVKLLTQGRTRNDGHDLRIVDATGQAVPFQLNFLAADRYALLTFRVTDLKGRYFIYFGNPNATQPPPEMIRADPKPGSGPPKGAWIPKAGLVLETRVRPRAADLTAETNPKTVADMQKLLADSPRAYGAGFRSGIADGYNPFGASDYYISCYRGWLRVPKTGTYQFCTVSNEASFSFLDGKDLIHWPDRHTVARGIYGEKNVKVELTAGLHYIEYYHEETTLEQMAFLGWRPSGDAGPFAPIPPDIYPQPHSAGVRVYETTTGPIPTFEPIITDSLWPVTRSEGQYTKVRLSVGLAATWPNDAQFTWDFGDGTSAVGNTVEHVYLTLGLHPVTLTVTRPNQAAQQVTWPLEVFEIDHVVEQFREGRPKDYAQICRTYDRSKLSAATLKELAYLFSEAEQPAEAAQTCEVYLNRFAAQSDPLLTARVRRLLADCALRTGQEGVAVAIANYQAALIDTMPALEKVQVLTRLIRLLGIERQEAAKAVAVLDQVEAIVRQTPKTDELLRAYRQAVMAVADVHLWQRQLAEAAKLYRRVETLRGEPIPANVRAAKIGAYPDSLREYTATGNYGAAIDLVDQWEDLFPTDKLNGHSFFWRGKLLHLRGQHLDAARYLKRAVEVTSGAPFESEARWLLAEALEQSGKSAEAQAELRQLLRIGLKDEFVQKAAAKLHKKP